MSVPLVHNKNSAEPTLEGVKVMGLERVEGVKP